MFEGFTLERIDVGEAQLRVRYARCGPAVLLLHGHPRTHATWEKVAPMLLRDGYSVVCPDLRGYGGSSKPATTADHEPYSKRAMARDGTALMHALGFAHFAVVGHDRGAYVAFRTAMDHPGAVTHLAVLDAVPIGEALVRCDARFAEAWYHWFFLAQPAPLAERVISADPDAWYKPSRRNKSTEAFDDYYAAIHDPQTIHAMCEDYRAGLHIDRAHDEADKEAGRRIACPTLAVWARADDMERLYGDPLAIWREWASHVRGVAIDCGHHLAEEAPQELAAILSQFVAAS